MSYETWLAGGDLRSMLPRRTFYKFRSELLVHGIDIATIQSREASNIVPLVRILEAVPVGVPEWAQGTPLYFEPRRVA
jgi:II/X family phage/plasmid replication protein